MIRYWLTPCSSVYREWTAEEYHKRNPNERITQTLPYVRCSHCGQIIGLHFNITETHETYCNSCWAYNTSPLQVVYLNTELHCLEHREVEFDGKTCYYMQEY